MSEVQHIIFEGRDCVVMAPEDYDALAAQLKEARELLRRSLPDLVWADEASRSLDDPSIIAGIEDFLAKEPQP